jgi:hypothetical protein
VLLYHRREFEYTNSSLPSFLSLRAVTPPIEFIRAFRTSTSERFILRKERNDCAALDLHYLADGTVQCTLIVFDGSALTEDGVPSLLAYIDDVLLPDVSLDDQKLFFTVVFGRVLGSFEAEKTSTDASINTEHL